MLILLYAIQGGAAEVIGMDLASIIERARICVADNGLDSRVTLLMGRVEETKMLPKNIEKVLSVNQGFLSNREGKTSSTSGIDTVGEARGTIPEGNEVLPRRRTPVPLIEVALYWQRDAKTSHKHCNSTFFINFSREQ